MNKLRVLFHRLTAFDRRHQLPAFDAFFSRLVTDPSVSARWDSSEESPRIIFSSATSVYRFGVKSGLLREVYFDEGVLAFPHFTSAGTLGLSFANHAILFNLYDKIRRDLDDESKERLTAILAKHP